MSSSLRVSVVVGNPKPRSRTLQAAILVAERLSGRPDVTIDLAELGAGLLDPADATTSAAIRSVQESQLVVVASPTYKAAYTGLLKLFLDRFPSNGLAGVVAVPLMLGAGPRHALAPEHTLRPVLVELGATTPTRGLYLLDSDFDDADVLEQWAGTAAHQVVAAVHR
ncbi:NADPH-dependent FMN reductase [metagenome]|uniref:NADPH-dependent FMN reductase n=1 Tax=metagenome TaxID=256318 RepID=A0A2P2CFV4_9ZZZZ